MQATRSPWRSERHWLRARAPPSRPPCRAGHLSRIGVPPRRTGTSPGSPGNGATPPSRREHDPLLPPCDPGPGDVRERHRLRVDREARGLRDFNTSPTAATRRSHETLPSPLPSSSTPLLRSADAESVTVVPAIDPIWTKRTRGSPRAAPCPENAVGSARPGGPRDSRARRRCDHARPPRGWPCPTTPGPPTG